MEYKKLITPEFRVTFNGKRLQRGIEVEFASSKESHTDWCKIEFGSQLYGIVAYEDMDNVLVELGYDDDYDTLIDGYARRITDDYWKEMLVKDDMILLERCTIKGTFIQSTPQDIIRYVLTRAGIKDYILDDVNYGQKARFSLASCNGIEAIKSINASWGINISFYVQEHRFYWGSKKGQKYIYLLEEENNILSMQKVGSLWEIETIGLPWIHQSEFIKVSHSKQSGVFEVYKVIIRSDDKGRVRQYLYFKGGT